MNRRRFVAGAGLFLTAPGFLAAQDTSGRRQNSKLIIEVRANEWTKRGTNPHIPYTDQEIVADALECTRVGAAIYHFHCRTANGEPNLTYPPYKDIVGGIRARSSILIHPTLGSTNSAPSPEERLSNVARLVAEGMSPDFVPIDLVTSNIDRFDYGRAAFETDNSTYVNTTRTQEYLATQAAARHLKPYLVCYGASSLREAQALVLARQITEPAFLSLELADGDRISAPPGTVQGLMSYLNLMPSNVRTVWTVFNSGGNLFPLIGAVIQLGGHISIGLGDYDYPELGQPSNADLVRRCIELGRECGREVASPAEARTILGMEQS